MRDSSRRETSPDEVLLRSGLLHPDQLRAIRTQQASGDRRSVAELALAAGWLRPEQLAGRVTESTLTSPLGPGSGRIMSGGMPERIGGYRVIRRLGMGAAGAVFEAEDPAGRRVAVKVLVDEEGDALERFRREQRLLSQLEDRAGFVSVLDSGDDPEGLYLVLELMEGGSLKERLEKENLSIDAVLRLGRSLARSLGQAHQLGIVHRDIKPANVLFDREDRAKIADFGIGKHYRRDRAANRESVSLTAEGQIVGTPAYMAPEQLDDSRGVGPEADVYALGALLYRCLTGLRLYRGGNAAEVLFQVMKGGWTPILELRPDCPRWLARVVSRCLALDPADRYPDGAALARALTPKRPAARRPKPGRRLALLTLPAVFGLVILGLAFLRGAGEAPKPEPPSLKAPRPPRPAPSPRRAPKAPALEPLVQGVTARYAAAWRGRSWVLDRVLSKPMGKHQSMVSQLCLHPDGSSAVSAALEGVIRQWSLRDGRELRAIDSGFERVTALDLSADGRWLVAAGHPPGRSKAPTIKAWELSSGELKFEQSRADEAGVYAIACAAKEAYVFLGALAYTLDFDGFRLRPLDLAMSAPVNAVDYADETGRLVVATTEGRLTMLDTRSGRVQRRRIYREGEEPKTRVPNQVLIHDGGRKALLAERSGDLSEWSLEPAFEELRATAAIRPEERRYVAGWLRCVAISEDGQRVFCGGDDFAVRVYDYASFERRDTLCQVDSWVHCLAALPGSEGLVLGGNEMAVQRWSLDGTKLWGAEGACGPVTALKVREDGKRLVSFGADKRLICWDLVEGKALWRQRFQATRVNAIAFETDGSVVVGGGIAREDGSALGVIQVFRPDGEPLRPLAGLGLPEVLCLAQGAKRGEAIAGDAGGGVYAPILWPQRPRRVRHRGPVLAVWLVNRGRNWRSVSTDGLVLEWSRDGSVKIVGLPDPQPSALAFPRPNDTVIYFGSRGLYARALEGGTIRPFESGQGDPVCGAMALGEQAFAMAFGDGRLGLWDPDTRGLIDQLEPKLPGEIILALAFEPDGRRLWVGTSRGSILALRPKDQR